MAPFEAVQAGEEVVFASAWDSERRAPHEHEPAPWEVVGAESAVDPDKMWESFDVELAAWLEAGLCPHCENALPSMVGRPRVVCGFCGSHFETPEKIVLLNFAD